MSINWITLPVERNWAVQKIFALIAMSESWLHKAKSVQNDYLIWFDLILLGTQFTCTNTKLKNIKIELQSEEKKYCTI